MGGLTRPSYALHAELAEKFGADKIGERYPQVWWDVILMSRNCVFLRTTYTDHFAWILHLLRHNFSLAFPCGSRML